MAKLKPAGLIAQLISFFTPKEVAVQVRAETLSNGQVEIVPVFTIDGQEVPSKLVAPDTRQTILGYSVVLDRNSQNVHSQTQGKPTRLSKREAAEFLTELGKAGVA